MTQLEKRKKLLDINAPNRAKRLFDPASGILFWDNVINPKYYELYKEMRGDFWVPDETSLSGDYKCMNDGRMSKEDIELFKRAIGVLASLDSIASEYDKFVAFYIRDASINNCITFAGMMETIHNESYTYILSTLLSFEIAKEVFEMPLKDPSIISRNKIIMDQFDEFIKNPTVENFIKGQCAMSALEGLSFTNGFVPFYYFNNKQKMSGTGTIIQQINRDETKHSQLQAMTVKDAKEQYADQLDIEGLNKWTYDFFTKLVENEKLYSQDLLKSHPDIDIYNVERYVEFRANLILDNMGLDRIFATKKNPLKWIKAYDPENMNNMKTDFFEDKEANYTRVDNNDGGWNDL